MTLFAGLEEDAQAWLASEAVAAGRPQHRTRGADVL